MNPHERVRDLLRLATTAGTPEHEARNAAWQAAKLIAEHKLLDNAPQTNAGPSSPFAAIFGGDMFGVVMRNLNTMAIGMSAMEILELRQKAERLERANTFLQAEAKRLAALVTKMQDEHGIPLPTDPVSGYENPRGTARAKRRRRHQHGR
jgi:hypothetical protein